MKIARTVASFRRLRQQVAGEPLVLVPTMGALHHGHAALIQRARRLVGPKGSVVVAIFVNPAQFGPKEDFSRYPRPWNKDVSLCRAEGVTAIFAPSAEEMYPADRSVFVDEGMLSNYLCGASRPGHFRGVCTVVTKLFQITEPDAAVFGEKDWQQLAIIRRMVRDLNIPVQIVGQPTVREDDGLATSSRNVFLSPEERLVAPQIFRALAEASIETGKAAILKRARRVLDRIPGARLDYLSLVDAETLEPLASSKRPGRLAAALFLGKARLIDNVEIPPRQ